MIARVKSSVAFLNQFNKELWILALGWFVGAVGFAASIPFIAIYFHQALGMSTTEVGFFFGAMAVVRSFFQMVGGEMSDRVGRRGLLIHSQIYRAFMFLGIGVSIAYDWGFWAISFFLLVNSIFGAIFMPAVNAMVSDILPPEKRLDGFAISRAAGNLGWAIGPMIGGVLAASSYAVLFYISAVITLLSGIVFWIYLKVPKIIQVEERFKFSDLAEVRKDTNLAIHSLLILCLYLVVAQLIAPFSLYAVEMVGISEQSLGWLFGINGFFVAALQIPMTRMLGKHSFTTQLAWGSILYFIGYSLLGILIGFNWFVLLMIVITIGEVIMSPPSLTLTSRLAPEDRMGRYMGVYGFFVTVGWSFGPLWGGFFLDHFAHDPMLAWLLIASLSLVSAAGYWAFGKILPDEFNYKEGAVKKAEEEAVTT